MLQAGFRAANSWFATSCIDRFGRSELQTSNSREKCQSHCDQDQRDQQPVMSYHSKHNRVSVVSRLVLGHILGTQKWIATFSWKGSVQLFVAQLPYNPLVPGRSCAFSWGWIALGLAGPALDVSDSGSSTAAKGSAKRAKAEVRGIVLPLTKR